ncbi:RNA-binding protein 39-like [Clavelina lepadiformis]|uniref:RRM domain-containing protein n=1 Tax=Clavelina lepadiformis TaxID=159417 RepID=A0ABP0GZY3_CLALP
MADDLDVEAMLEAPFKKETEKTEEKSKSEKKSRKKSRSRSRSRSRRRHHRRSRSKSRDRSRSRHHRRSRSREKRRRPSRSKSPRRRERERKPKTPTPPPKPRSPSPPDRDARTVFCMQLAQRIRTRDLEEFFSAVGKVREVKLIQDKHSKRSKGIAYVEFKDLESIPLALGLSGQKILGVPIVVQPTQSEKNKVAAAQLTLQKAAQGPTKLYVGGLHENITEDMLKGIFSPFGRIEQVQIIKDADTSVSKGYAFITFAEADNAKRALDQLNGFEIAGKAIKLNTVGHTTDFNAFAALANGPSFLDNDAVERAGIDLGTTGRLQLMAKLAEGTGLEVPSAAQQALWLGQSMGLGLPSGPPAANAGAGGGGTGGANPPIATTCFQLSNMFDPGKESGTGWDVEIKDDVIEECQRHGIVLHVYVDKQSQGNVYVKCDSLEAAAKSVSALHGRYFAGNMITAAYVPVVNYHSLFPEAAYANQPLKPTNR